MKRRTLVTGGVAAAAVVSGVGWALRRQRQQAAQDDGLWALRFERPEGGELVMAELRGRLLVLNFWATWCPPCVKEMPELDRFHRTFAPQGWQVVGLAIDGPTPVRDFLRRVPVGFPIGLAGLGGTDLVRKLGNPAGGLDDLDAVASWGREREVLVCSDECYAEFTWDGPPGPGGLPGATILSSGSDGVLAVHSLSKRSNLAGLRVGFYAGDAALVHYLGEVRKHAGFMVPGPAQAAGAAALADQDHVLVQRDRYRRRLEQMAAVLAASGLEVPMPGGGFYLWVPAPDGDAWGLAERLAQRLGIVVSPGEFYGDAAPGHVRVAVVQPDEVIAAVAERAGIG